MAEDGFGTKWAPRQFYLQLHSSDDTQSVLRQESRILELLLADEPLPVVLNNLCVAIDLQVGNVVTIIWLAGDPEGDLETVKRRAVQFGLHLFWSGNVALPGGKVLGYLEIYGCDPRTPTPSELQLIDRVAHLAALAIRREQDEHNAEHSYMDWNIPPPTGSHDLN